MKELCRSKYEQETSEQVYNLLQQQRAYYSSPDQSSECSSVSQCAAIDSIRNPEIQRRLLQQYKNIAEQSRMNMFNLYLQSAEEEKNTYKKKYDAAEEKMRMDRRVASDDEKIPQLMIQLIEHRCKTMTDRIKCIYQYKVRSMAMNSDS